MIRLIEKTVLNQTDDQYPGQTLYEQMHALFGCKQGRMTLEQYYSIFNTRADVGLYVGVKHLHPGMKRLSARILFQATMETLTDAEMELVNTDAEERFLTFAFIFQSNCNGYKLDCQRHFGRNIAQYPANRQEALKQLR